MRAGRALEPTVIAVHSQRVHAELNGWRTPGGMILREPIQASVGYTPALARRGGAPRHCALTCLLVVLATAVSEFNRPCT